MGNHNGSSGIAVRALLTGVFSLLYVSFTPSGWRQHRGNSLRVPTHFNFLVTTLEKIVTPEKCYYIRYPTFWLHMQLKYCLYTPYTIHGKKKRIRDFEKLTLYNSFAIERHQFLSSYQARWGTEENCGPPLVLGPSPPDFPHYPLKGAKAWESYSSWNNVLTKGSLQSTAHHVLTHTIWKYKCWWIKAMDISLSNTGLYHIVIKYRCSL